MLANLHDGSSIHRQYSLTYFSSVILLVSVYPLPLTMRYRYMPFRCCHLVPSITDGDRAHTEVTVWGDHA